MNKSKLIRRARNVESTQLMAIAAINSPTQSYKKAIEAGFSKKEAKACRALAAVRTYRLYK